MKNIPPGFDGWWSTIRTKPDGTLKFFLKEIKQLLKIKSFLGGNGQCCAHSDLDSCDSNLINVDVVRVPGTNVPDFHFRINKKYPDF